MSGSAVDADGMPALSDLVKALPHLHQPIYGHPELSERVSRGCGDRLADLVAVCDAMQSMLQRPVRVLDLGCAQGFVSHSLAARGATVHGIDCLEENVAVCKRLAEERGDTLSTFETGNIVDVVPRLEAGCYDLVLGLSVFHCIVDERGASHVREMLGELGRKTLGCLFEGVLAGEPPYLGTSQPESTRALLLGFDFVHEIACHETHLPPFRWPLYFASNRCWFLDGRIGTFRSWSRTSNEMVSGVHADTRRFFFGEGRIVKLWRLDDEANHQENLKEWSNEVAFLTMPPPGYCTPRLETYGRNTAEAWLLRDCLPGDTLDRCIVARAVYDPHRVLTDVLSQLVALERAGLYHNDVRTWNVVIDPRGHATLIDYGAITHRREDCAWPHDVFLSFMIFMREVIDAVQERPIPLRPFWFNPDALPQPYKGAAWAMLRRPAGERQFADLLEDIKRGQSDGNAAVPEQHTGLTILLQATEAASRHYRERINMLEGCSRGGDWAREAVEAARAEAAAAAKEAALERERLAAVLGSTSWRVTGPLRSTKSAAKWFARGASAWITRKPGSCRRR